MLRAVWAVRLRSGSAGAPYRDALARALARLDRVSGPPGSIRALGVCFLVAVAYAWVTYFLGWGFFGGSGGIGGFELMPDALKQPSRGIAAASAIGLPPAMFLITFLVARFIGGREARLRVRLQPYWSQRLGEREC